MSTDKTITDDNTLIAALIEPIEEDKNPTACYVAVRDRLAPGIKRNQVEQLAKQLIGFYEGDGTDYSKYAWYEFKDKRQLLNTIAKQLTVKALEVKAKAEELRAQPLASHEEFLARRKEVEAILEELRPIDSLLSMGEITVDRVDSMLKLIGEPADLVDEAERLFGE